MGQGKFNLGRGISKNTPSQIQIRRERSYIWLERRLKINLILSSLLIATFLLMMLFFFQLPAGSWGLFFAAAFIINGCWHYILYRQEYRNYLSIARYLEEFEAGNYVYREREDYMKTGIYPQIVEQMERMGEAFDTLKSRIVEEKENTKAALTDISHQLKTPVSVLNLSYELLGDEAVTDAEKREFFYRGRKEVKRLEHLMEVLMNLSRLEADMIKLNPRKASLKETLICGVNGIYIKAEEKRIDIEMEEFQDIFLIHDSKWTAEAVSNVLDNAVKYSEEGKKIRMSVERLISYVLIKVEDEGIGIPKSDYLNIFKRFYRGSSPEVEQEEGAGVGLYLVRQILEKQGGSVCVCAAHSGGTIIQMMLPLSSGR